MQISRTLLRSKVASIHFRRRLTVVLALIFLIVIIALVVVQGFSQITVAAGDGDSQGGTGGSGDPLNPVPEYGFSGGGVVALVIGFAAFALFTKRGKLLGKEASA
jgi:hypothetical protein